MVLLMGSASMSRYSAKLLEHFHAPRNGGALKDAHAIGHGSLNGRPPRSQIYLQFYDDQVCRAAFTTFGCGVSIACCSVLTEMVIGKSVTVCQQITSADVKNALDGVPADKDYCAAIAVEALHDALKSRPPSPDVT